MPPKKQTKEEPTDPARLRIAIVSGDQCKPKKCLQECKRNCPVNRTGKICIEVDSTSKIAFISEPLCIGCGICVKKCPFDAISIINLPMDLGTETTHRFGPNTFKLHRLPTPRAGQVLGLVGTNGIGKSTALRILSGKLKPNLGKYISPPEWKQILEYFRGSELQNYFTRVLEGLKALLKPQYVDALPKQVKGKVRDIIKLKKERPETEELIDRLDLRHLLDRNVPDLSGGELQRFALLVMAIQSASVYMVDEPSSYLDVKQRLAAAQVIRSLLTYDNYVIVVEHDLSVLDYLSDFICVLWGSPGHYGVVSLPTNVREGINIFLDGFMPTENLRFRDESLSFKLTQDTDEEIQRMAFYHYGPFKKKLGSFALKVEKGNFNDSEIIVMLGQNGTGKTTFIRMLAGILQPDVEEGDEGALPKLHVSYKPQTISAKFEGTVRQLFHQKIRDAYTHPQFNTDVIKPLKVDTMYDQQVQHLSGGELQRVALTVALGKPADIYLIDEPSAYLDSEQRVMAARVMKRYIFHCKKTAFIVEHDFIMATYLADRVVVFLGNKGVDCVAQSPEPLVTGMNRFLKLLNITFRRDPVNYRPRINKLESIKDKEQKVEPHRHHCREIISALLMGCFHSVPNDQIYVVERCGKFDKFGHPGFLCIPIPGVYEIKGKISTRITQLDVPVETKTKDNVFVQLTVSVQYMVQQGKTFEAFYSLANPQEQIRSYVFDVVRAAVPRQNLDEVFESKDEIARAVKNQLLSIMTTFGFLIVQTLVTDVNPDPRVKAAMNEINASKRNRQAAEEKAEADKLLVVKKAEADAEAKYLQGSGIARQRRAIIDGLRESVTDFSQKIQGVDAKDVLDLVLITQYFDTMKDLGALSGEQTIFVPNNPGSLATLAQEIKDGVLQNPPHSRRALT